MDEHLSSDNYDLFVSSANYGDNGTLMSPLGNWCVRCCLPLLCHYESFSIPLRKI